PPAHAHERLRAASAERTREGGRDGAGVSRVAWGGAVNVLGHDGDSSAPSRGATETRLAHVVVHLHGPLADRAGSRVVRIGVTEGSEISAVWSALRAVFPDVEAIRAQCALAR